MRAKVDPIVILLFIGTFVSLTALLVVNWVFPTDGQIFQVVAGIVAMFSGALFTKIKSHDSDKKDESQ